MSLRTFKTFLKRTNRADKDALDMHNSARQDEFENGLQPGESYLNDYVLDALAIARYNYVRMKRAFKGLTKRQQKRMIGKTNTKSGIRNTLDKVI